MPHNQQCKISCNYKNIFLNAVIKGAAENLVEVEKALLLSKVLPSIANIEIIVEIEKIILLSDVLSLIGIHFNPISPSIFKKAFHEHGMVIATAKHFVKDVGKYCIEMPYLTAGIAGSTSYIIKDIIKDGIHKDLHKIFKTYFTGIVGALNNLGYTVEITGVPEFLTAQIIEFLETVLKQSYQLYLNNFTINNSTCEKILFSIALTWIDTSLLSFNLVALEKIFGKYSVWYISDIEPNASLIKDCREVIFNTTGFCSANIDAEMVNECNNYNLLGELGI